MKRKRFSEEQIIGILKEREAGKPVTELCRRHGMSSPTFYAWKSKYSGMDVSNARKLTALEDENRRLKKVPAGSMLDQAALKDLLSKNGAARIRAAFKMPYDASPADHIRAMLALAKIEQSRLAEILACALFLAAAAIGAFGLFLAGTTARLALILRGLWALTAVWVELYRRRRERALRRKMESLSDMRAQVDAS